MVSPLKLLWIFWCDLESLLEAVVHLALRSQMDRAETQMMAPRLHKCGPAGAALSDNLAQGRNVVLAAPSQNTSVPAGGRRPLCTGRKALGRADCGIRLSNELDAWVRMVQASATMGDADHKEQAMDAYEEKSHERERRLDLMRQTRTPISVEQDREIHQERTRKPPPGLKPISLERAQEISLRTLYEALRKRIDRDEKVLDLFPKEFAEQIRKERKEQGNG